MSASPHSPAPAPELRLALPISAQDLNARLDDALSAAAEKIVRERLADEQVISLAEAAALTPWTEAGFKRVAARENLPFIKGLHKSPPSYRRGAVIAMLRGMQIWPKGKPAEVVPFSNAA